MEIKIKYRGRSISINVKKLSFFGRFSGLMFRTLETENLLFDFGKDTNMPIHSFFVFFPFLAIWVDEKNNVIEKRIVSPFSPSVSPKNEFRRLIEVPINEKNKKILRFFKN